MSKPQKDTVKPQSGFLCTYMSNHPDTLVAYVRHQGRVSEEVQSAKMTSIDQQVSELAFAPENLRVSGLAPSLLIMHFAGNVTHLQTRPLPIHRKIHPNPFRPPSHRLLGSKTAPSLPQTRRRRVPRNDSPPATQILPYPPRNVHPNRAAHAVLAVYYLWRKRTGTVVEGYRWRR